MAKKADFTLEEWQQILSLPQVACFDTGFHRGHSAVAETIPLRAWCADHKAALIVAGGLVSGAATSLLPLRPLMKLGSAFASTAMLMLRFPLADLIAWREGERASGDAAAGNAQ